MTIDAIYHAALLACCEMQKMLIKWVLPKYIQSFVMVRSAPFGALFKQQCDQTHLTFLNITRGADLEKKFIRLHPRVSMFPVTSS